VPANVPSRPPGVPRPPAIPAQCRGWTDGRARADLLLAGRYWLGSHPVEQLGLDPTWREDPLIDSNWQFMHHSLQVVSSLLEAWADTARPEYIDRAEFLLHDWIRENPRSAPMSVWAWNDHSTALRADVLACASMYLPDRPWLRRALVLHGEALAEPRFYVNHGNHALNQSIALLEVGHVVGRADWMQLATNRIAKLILESVDDQGVTDEQSIGYQAYNLERYRLVQARLEAMGMPVPAAFARLDWMPKFLAYATRPDGLPEMIGDTEAVAQVPTPGSWWEYATSQGAHGTKPSDTVAVYRAGYVFARTGWGETGPFTDEVFLSQRFGPAPYIHGHADGTSLTLYGYGSPLLLDGGKYDYDVSPYRSFFKGRTAHNVVTVDGLKFSKTAATTLVDHTSTATMVDTTTATSGYAGVAQQRRVTFSRALGYVVVEDRASSFVEHTFRQLWHLGETADPVLWANGFRTTSPRGNVQVRQLLGGTSARVVEGQVSPVQGWISYRHRQLVSAPVIEVVASGTSARYLTLIVPAAGRPAATVTDLQITSTGYSMVVTIGGVSERVTVGGSNASIVALS
jgi:heparinase II/III-like protein